MRTTAARLYDDAFRSKLRPAIPDDDARWAILEAGLRPEKSIAALEGERLLGIAGFHDDSGSLTSGITFGSIRARIGCIRSLRATAVFALLERKPEHGELLMDGIVVDQEARGRGVGTGLFGELEALARERGFARIRLDVVDTNPAARRLYERLGFEAVRTERIPFLQPLMGFAAATRMLKRLD